jgi:hypothetical protein
MFKIRGRSSQNLPHQEMELFVKPDVLLLKVNQEIRVNVHKFGESKF